MLQWEEQKFRKAHEKEYKWIFLKQTAFTQKKTVVLNNINIILNKDKWQ